MKYPKKYVAFDNSNQVSQLKSIRDCLINCFQNKNHSGLQNYDMHRSKLHNSVTNFNNSYPNIYLWNNFLKLRLSYRGTDWKASPSNKLKSIMHYHHKIQQCRLDLNSQICYTSLTCNSILIYVQLSVKIEGRPQP